MSAVFKSASSRAIVRFDALDTNGWTVSRPKTEMLEHEVRKAVTFAHVYEQWPVKSQLALQLSI